MENIQKQISLNKPTFIKNVSKTPKKDNLTMIIVAILVVLAGVGTGWFLSGSTKGKTQEVAPGAKQTATEAGSEDEETFRDMAEGLLEEGGINGEGTHHLKRDGDTGQFVYLTSTVIDLQSFVGKKVKVWGETVTGKKAGWLMDVGKLKVIN
jgi:hypothetical protein